MNKILMCGLTLAASALFAETPPALARLNVTAVDSGGTAIDDLKIGDLQISDQGKAEKIVFFHQNLYTPAPPAPNEFSNRIGAPPHSTVILFDLLNQNQSDRLDAWHKLGRSLQQLESGDSLYLYLLALEGNLIPIHEIGNKAGDDKTWTQQVEKTLDKAMKAASHARPTQMNDEELVVKKTYVALETLATQLAALPGRRDIVWITNTMPNVWNTKNPCNGDWVDCALYVPHLAVTLTAANTSVNPFSYTSSPSPAVTRDLEQIGLLSGGSSYFGDDIRSVLTQLTRDAARSYSVFYDTPPENWDSKWHKLRVTTERKGLKLRVKQRYYAFPDERPDAAKRQPVLAAAFQAPYDDPAIGLRATVSPGADAKSVQVQFRIDSASLFLREEGDTYSGAVIFLIADRGATGPVGDPMLINYPIHLTRDQMKEGVAITQTHAVNDAIKNLRIIVLDQGSNIAGSVTVPLGGK